jgi:hypothetical protein
MQSIEILYSDDVAVDDDGMEQQLQLHFIFLLNTFCWIVVQLALLDVWPYGMQD